nr:proline-rich protein HaeIII subfamily 1-like [Zootoca vivipara]
MRGQAIRLELPGIWKTQPPSDLYFLACSDPWWGQEPSPFPTCSVTGLPSCSPNELLRVLRKAAIKAALRGAREGSGGIRTQVPNWRHVPGLGWDGSQVGREKAAPGREVLGPPRPEQEPPGQDGGGTRDPRRRPAFSSPPGSLPLFAPPLRRPGTPTCGLRPEGTEAPPRVSRFPRDARRRPGSPLRRRRRRVPAGPPLPPPRSPSATDGRRDRPGEGLASPHLASPPAPPAAGSASAPPRRMGRRRAPPTSARRTADGEEPGARQSRAVAGQRGRRPRPVRRSRKGSPGVIQSDPLQESTEGGGAQRV